MDIRQEVPIHSFSIGAYIARTPPGREEPEFLLLRRAQGYLKDTWQMVTGMIENGETAWQAALREVREETGITPDDFFSTGLLENFYLARLNLINMAPIFLAICRTPREVRLSPEEHGAYRWTSVEEAAGLLAFPQQIENLRTIEDMFFQRTPAEFLRIEIEPPDHP